MSEEVQTLKELKQKLETDPTNWINEQIENLNKAITTKSKTW